MKLAHEKHGVAQKVSEVSLNITKNVNENTFFIKI